MYEGNFIEEMVRIFWNILTNDFLWWIGQSFLGWH